MHPFTVCFFGNSIIDNPMAAEKALNGVISKLLREKDYVVFLVGRNGDFDVLVASVVHRCKGTIRSDNSALVWVMPYLSAEYRGNEASFQQYFDEIEVCEESIGKHYKAAFQIRNRSMIDRSELSVFWVQRGEGGAWKAMCYAQKIGKPAINLAEGSGETGNAKFSGKN